MVDEIPKLTTEEIYSVLANKIGSCGFELLSYEFQRPDEKIGLLGEHIIIKTTVNLFTNVDADETNSYPKDVKTFTFFAKFFPLLEPQIFFCNETGAFAKEIFLYEIFTRMKTSGITLLDCVPDCYFSKQDYVIVTEYLSEQDYQMVDKNEPLDYEMVLVVIRSLAKLHASSIIFEEIQSKNLGQQYTFLHDHESDLGESLFYVKNNVGNANVESAIKGILSEIDIFNCPEKLASGKNFKSVAKNACRQVYELVKRNNKCRNVLSHGDLWSTNFLIKFDAINAPIDCKLVDFQHARYLPPSHDLLSMLYLTTTREFRRKHMYDVIGLYYYYLEKHLKVGHLDIKDVISFGDFMESCEEQKLFAIVQSAMLLPLVLVDNGRLQDLFSDAEFSEYTFSVDRTRLILANIDLNQIYRRRLGESILDLKDYCDNL